MDFKEIIPQSISKSKSIWEHTEDISSQVILTHRKTQSSTVWKNGIIA
jgi:hypothetical protein